MNEFNIKSDFKLFGVFLSGSFLIIAGLFIPYLNILALLILSIYIFRMNKQEISYVLIYFVSFASIFKLSLIGFSLFNLLIFISILRILLLSRFKIKFYFSISFLIFSLYVIIFSFQNGISELIKFLSYIFILGLIYNHERINFKKTLTSCIWGVIVTSFLALFSRSIPRLYQILILSTIKTGAGEYYYRFAGIEANPNYYTVIISICLAGLLTLIIIDNLNFMYYFYFGILSIFGFMSVSQSFIITYFITLFFGAYELLKSRHRSRVLLILIVIIISTVVFRSIGIDTINTLIFRFRQLISSNSFQEATTGRTGYIANYLQYFASNILKLIFGNGIGAQNLDIGASHSFFIDITYYLGILGGVLYILCLRSILYVNNISTRNIKFYQYLPLGVFIIRAMARNLIASEQLIFILIICFLSIYNKNEKIGV